MPTSRVLRASLSVSTTLLAGLAFGSCALHGMQALWSASLLKSCYNIAQSRLTVRNRPTSTPVRPKTQQLAMDFPHAQQQNIPSAGRMLAPRLAVVWSRCRPRVVCCARKMLRGGVSRRSEANRVFPRACCETTAQHIPTRHAVCGFIGYSIEVRASSSVSMLDEVSDRPLRVG